MPRYNKISDFFENPTIRNSYWAGFIAADGNINDKINAISIKLKSTDDIILKKFQEDIGHDGQIYYYTERGKHSATLRINNAKTYFTHLEKHWNITARKSLTLLPPNLENELALSYIVGYIDGDGYIGITKNNNCKTSKLELTILGTEKLLSWIGNTLYEYENKNLYIVSKICCKGNYFRLSYISNRAYKILKLLQDVETPFRLERKWNKIQEFEELYQNA